MLDLKQSNQIKRGFSALTWPADRLASDWGVESGLVGMIGEWTVWSCWSDWVVDGGLVGLIGDWTVWSCWYDSGSGQCGLVGLIGEWTVVLLV